MENLTKDDGQEPYIPSVHLKNIAPLEWLKTEEAKKFIEDMDFEFENLSMSLAFTIDALTSPTCVKCNERLSKQDSRGWEELQKNIWICPNCIEKFQHTEDLLDYKESGEDADLVAPKHYFVLDIDGNPMVRQEETDVGPLNVCQFKSVEEAEEFIKKKNKGAGGSNPAWAIAEYIIRKEF